MKKREPRSYLVNAFLASGALYFAFDLSRSGRTAIDWIVLSLVSLAIGWNLLQLGGRLHRVGGGRAVWHLVRTVMFWTVGLSDTVLTRHESTGSWTRALGWVVLLLAVGDSIALYRKEQSLDALATRGGETPASD